MTTVTTTPTVRIVPVPDQPTTDSIRAAQAQMLADRKALERDFGLIFDPFRDGQLKRDRRRK